MEHEVYGFGIEITNEKVTIVNHELAMFNGRIFKILILKDHIEDPDYETKYKIFSLLQKHTENHGKIYEIKKILKE